MKLHRLLEGKCKKCEAPFLPLHPFLISASGRQQMLSSPGKGMKPVSRSRHGRLSEKLSCPFQGRLRLPTAKQEQPLVSNIALRQPQA